MNTTGRPATAWLRRLRGANNEGVLALILVLLVVGVSIANPAFFSMSMAFQIARNAIVPLILALGVLLVIILGGIDVSFPAIAIFSAYTTVTVMTDGGDFGLIVALVVAIGIGAALGAINGLLIARFRLPTLIVTLGTQTIFSGALIAYVGSRYITSLPPSMAAWSTSHLISQQTPQGMANLHVMVIPAVALALAVAWLLRRTMFGRSVYAIGGDIEGARRAGIRVRRTQVLVFVLVGVMAALAGMIFIIMQRSASPRSLLGGELDIIAAVVLGGASIFGGKGSVLGTVLGVVTVQIIQNSLILAGVPAAWQRFAVGVVLVVAVGIQASVARRAAAARRAPVEFHGPTGRQPAKEVAYA